MMSEETTVLSEEKINELLKIKGIYDPNYIRNLPIISLKEVTPNINKSLAKIFDIHKINDLANLTISEDKKKELEDEGISYEELQKWIIASKLLTNTEVLENKIERQKGKKIVFVGLENAGKTAIIQTITKNTTIDTISNLEPTITIDRKTFVIDDNKLIMWDFGGQKEYREQYLKNPERYFLEIDALIFVIDIQESEKFDEALNYLKNILSILDYLKENPEKIILLHKADPDIICTEQIITSIDELQTKVAKIMNNKAYSIFATSIFNAVPQSNDIIKALKEMGTIKKECTSKPKLTNEDLAETLDRSLTIFVKLSTYIEEKLNDIYGRLTNLEDLVLGIVDNFIKNGNMNGENSYQILHQPEMVEKKVAAQKSAIHDELKKIFSVKKIED